MQVERRSLTPEETAKEMERMRALWDAGTHSRCWMSATESGQRFYGECICGYRSATRTSPELVEEALAHHYRKMLSEDRRNGIRRNAAPLKVVSTIPVTRSA